MGKKKRKDQKSSWILAICSTLVVVFLVCIAGYALLGMGVLEPYERNGINKIYVTCDGQEGEIWTQRYWGFQDYDITTFKEFVDIPMVMTLQCQESSIRVERRKDLLDRNAFTAYCGPRILGGGEMASFEPDCTGELTLEVQRI